MTARAVAVGSAGGISRLPVMWPTNTLPLPEPFPPLEKTGPATATVAARASPATPEMIPIVFLLRMKPPFDPPARALDLHREVLPEKPKSSTAAEGFPTAAGSPAGGDPRGSPAARSCALRPP